MFYFEKKKIILIKNIYNKTVKRRNNFFFNI